MINLNPCYSMLSPSFELVLLRCFTDNPALRHSWGDISRGIKKHLLGCHSLQNTGPKHG